MESTETLTSQAPDPQGQSDKEAVTPTTATPEVVASQPVAPETPEQPTNESTQVPTKFVGKTFEEITKSYLDLEKEKGRLAQEAGEAKKRAKELEDSLNRAQQASTPPPAPIQTQPVKSLEEIYQEEWEQDPRQATINYQRNKEIQRWQTESASQTQNFASQAMTGKVTGYEDFPELLPTIKDLAAQYGGLLRPEFEAHPVALQLLTLVARGLKQDERIDKAAQAKAKQLLEKERQKNQAFGEGSSTATVETVDWSTLSAKEMEKLLPHAPMVE